MEKLGSGIAGEIDGQVDRTNVLSRGAGVEDPAEDHGAAAHAHTGTKGKTG